MKNKLKHFSGIIVTLALALVLGAATFVMPETVHAAGEIETVTIGSESEKSDWLPHRTSWKYSRTQIVYDADAIGKDGQIVSLAYNVASPSSGYRLSGMRIWMGYTDQDSFDYNSKVSDLLREPDVIQVYDGRPDIGNTTGWQTIDLDEPFEYDHNNGNLVIVTSVSVAQKGDSPLEYYCTVYGNGFDRNSIKALEVDSDDDFSVTELTYSGGGPVRIRSSIPDIMLSFDTSSGGEAASCEVSFDTDGGTPVPETQVISRGGKVVRPEDPTREGYKFTGWHKGDNEYNFDSRVSSSFTLKAGWTRVHTIRFLGWNEEELQTSQVDDGVMPEYTGETPVRPDEGGKEYLFAGWDPAIKEADSDQTYTAVFIDKSELADKTELNAAIKSATDARTGVKTSTNGKDVGKNFEYVSEAQWQAYDDALKEAQAVADDPYAKQPAVDKAVSDLEAAKTAFLDAKKKGTKTLSEITDIVISRNSGRQQPAVGGSYEWKVTFAEGTDLSRGIVTDDDFQVPVCQLQSFRTQGRKEYRLSDGHGYPG